MKQINIKIKGQPYTICYVKNLYGSLGLTDTENKFIYVQKIEDIEELQRTIIHELIHAYFYECGLLEYSQSETLAYWFESHFKIINNDFIKIFQNFEPNKIKFENVIDKNK